jgi:hypothetical protein
VAGNIVVVVVVVVVDVVVVGVYVWRHVRRKGSCCGVAVIVVDVNVGVDGRCIHIWWRRANFENDGDDSDDDDDDDGDGDGRRATVNIWFDTDDDNRDDDGDAYDIWLAATCNAGDDNIEDDSEDAAAAAAAADDDDEDDNGCIVCVWLSIRKGCTVRIRLPTTGTGGECKGCVVAVHIWRCRGRCDDDDDIKGCGCVCA